MENVSKIGWRDLQQTLMVSVQLFSRVRLIEPKSLCELQLTKDGEFKETGNSCYKIWEKDKKCSNCTGRCAVYEGGSFSKTEYFENQSYHIVSNCITVVDKAGNPREMILEMVSKTTEHSQERARLYEYDCLTGLYNRLKFFEVIQQRIQKDPETKYAFIRVDLDRFRLYNSFFGEAEGDRLLIFFAEKIKESVTIFGDPLFGRIESDVFGIFCPYNENYVKILYEKLIADLQNYNDTYYIEPSIGVYIVDDTKLPVEEMYDRASLAVESCKNKFMSGVGYYNKTMTDELLVEQELMNEAQKALEEEQFVVYLQPKTNLHTEKPYGAEALVRWNHPNKGVVSPGKFIPVFESNGFISRLDYYMWEQTCKLLRRWLDVGLNPAPVSVNVSRANMYNPNLVENFKELVNKYKIPARLLQLELTESAFMDDSDMMIDKVKSLRENGFTVLMDDFGSGYSSLNTLKDIPVDILKVDMKFLGTGDGSGRSERILASVVRMAAWLDLVVIVEGVETKQQRNFLESIGCEYVQGYYYAKPMPWQEYENTLRNPDFYQRVKEEQMANFSILEQVFQMNPELEKTFSTSFEPAAIYQYVEGEITLLQMNGEFHQMFGKRVSKTRQFVNNNTSILEKYVSKIRNAFAKCIQKKKTANCDYLYIHENGESSWQRIKLHHICTQQGKSIILAVFYDVSQEKELEQEIRRYQRCVGEMRNSII